jgi:hypothetical protein
MVHVFGVCLARPRGELYLRWQREGLKDKESVVFMNVDTSYTVPRSRRWDQRLLYNSEASDPGSVQRVATRDSSSQIAIESRELEKQYMP